MPALQPVQIFLQESPTLKGVEFEPVSISNGLATYTGQFAAWTGGTGNDPEVVPTSAVLRPSLSISLQKPSKTSRISKVRVKIVIPQPTLDNGVATLAKDRESSIDITIMSSERALPVEREQLIQVLEKLFADSTFKAVAVDNKSIY